MATEHRWLRSAGSQSAPWILLQSGCVCAIAAPYLERVRRVDDADSYLLVYSSSHSAILIIATLSMNGGLRVLLDGSGPRDCKRGKASHIVVGSDTRHKLFDVE